MVGMIGGTLLLLDKRRKIGCCAAFSRDDSYLEECGCNWEDSAQLSGLGAKDENICKA